MRIHPFLLALAVALALFATPASTFAAEMPAPSTTGDEAKAPPPEETSGDGAGDADAVADADADKEEPVGDAAPADGEPAPARTTDDEATPTPPRIVGAPPPADGGARRPPPAPSSPLTPVENDASPRPAPAPRPAMPSPGASPSPPLQGVLGLPALTHLRQTRDRPLFVPARRGVQPEPAAPILAPPPTPEPVEEAPPPMTLTLTGVVAGPDVAMAILVDPADGRIKRMHVGDEHEGWRLDQIDRVAVTFRRDEEEAVLALKPPGSAPSETGGRRPAAQRQRQAVEDEGEN